MQLFAFALTLLALHGANALNCNIESVELPERWTDMAHNCTMEMERQIKKEVDASIQYLGMASYFSRDTVNRPGFAKLFFEAASEEREHALKLIEYLLMRGELSKTSGLVALNDVAVDDDLTTEAALERALELETDVTISIRRVIGHCEVAKNKDKASFNDYHLVDYLSGDFLDEQYKGQRDLAGKLSTLKKMKLKQGELGEFLFDKKLLTGGLFK